MPEVQPLTIPWKVFSSPFDESQVDPSWKLEAKQTAKQNMSVKKSELAKFPPQKKCKVKWKGWLISTLHFPPGDWQLFWAQLSNGLGPKKRCQNKHEQKTIIKRTDFSLMRHNAWCCLKVVEKSCDCYFLRINQRPNERRCGVVKKKSKFKYPQTCYRLFYPFFLYSNRFSGIWGYLGFNAYRKAHQEALPFKALSKRVAI